MDMSPTGRIAATSAARDNRFIALLLETRWGVLPRLVRSTTLNQVLLDLDGRGADQDHEDRRKDEENQREDQLHGCLRRLLLGQLATPGSHRIGLNPKRLGDTRPETVGLDQNRGQAPHVVYSRPDAEI